MTYEQYYDGEGSLAKAYREAYQMRVEDQNTMMWLQGMYVYHAISDFVQFYNPFVKNPKAADYMDMPIPLSEDDKKNQNVERTRRAAEQMKLQVEAFNKKYYDEGQDDGD